MNVATNAHHFYKREDRAAAAHHHARRVRELTQTALAEAHLPARQRIRFVGATTYEPGIPALLQAPRAIAWSGAFVLPQPVEVKVKARRNNRDYGLSLHPEWFVKKGSTLRIDSMAWARLDQMRAAGL